MIKSLDLNTGKVKVIIPFILLYNFAIFQYDKLIKNRITNFLPFHTWL